MTIRALLVDDDLDLARLLGEYLSSHGVTLEHAKTGPEGLARARATAVDVVLLDVMLPGEDGFSVCKKLRAQRPSLPIIMLTARGDDADRIVGLELGADDYVPKPYNPRELLARINAVLRRAARPAEGSPSSAAAGSHTATAERITVGDLVVDVPAHAVTVAGNEVQLTSYEFRLLVALARRAGETIPREELAAAVKHGDAYDPSVDRSLDVHVSHLRQKLEVDPRDPKRIKTVRGVGYVLVRP